MKLWGGRFEQDTDLEVEKFSASMSLDHRLWKVDLQASVIHAQMLGRIGILNVSECEQIVQGLLSLSDEVQSGALQLNPWAEDIHSEIETQLSQKIGPLAGKLHTGRSRNDQIATDSRLYLREQIHEMHLRLRALQEFLVEISESNIYTLMPGLTHMQHAQPVSLAHHLMAYFWMFQRDSERLSDCLQRSNVSPLGSAALAGSGFPLDREFTSAQLGFSRPSENSLDAVSDRDFIVEFLSAGALIMVHLSRLSEELILWSTPEFNFVRLNDRVTTGSSIMPQKKNPDVAELIRGKSARLISALTGVLTLLKALPLSYNRDLQEDKHYFFEGVDTVQSCLRLMLLMLRNTDWNVSVMRSALDGDFSNATDLADDLVNKGIPFREAHQIVGKIVNHCLQTGKALEQLELNELRKFNELIDDQSTKSLRFENVVKARKTEGGTSFEAVQKQIESAKKSLQAACVSKT